MRPDLHTQDYIDAYLNGRMTSEQRIAFEGQMEQDTALQTAVREQKELLAAFEHHEKRSCLYAILDTLHEQMANAGEAADSIMKGNNVISLFFRENYKTIAIAASVAVITVISTLVSISKINSSDQKQSFNYVKLKREIDGIKRSQKQLIDDIQVSKTAEIMADYSGTGFAISPNGYILTSLHIVKGADSVFIENKGSGKFKVELMVKNEDLDIAVMRIADTSFKSFKNPPFTFRNTFADIGEQVFTLGYPREDIVFNEGSISAASGYEGDTSAYQVSLPVNPGNSGGPLLDENGQLAGIISGKNTGADGAAFAIKASYIEQFLKNLNKESPLDIPLILPKKNNLKGLKRTEQLKALQGSVFMVKVYNKKYSS